VLLRHSCKFSPQACNLPHPYCPVNKIFAYRLQCLINWESRVAHARRHGRERGRDMRLRLTSRQLRVTQKFHNQAGMQHLRLSLHSLVSQGNTTVHTYIPKTPQPPPLSVTAVHQSVVPPPPQRFRCCQRGRGSFKAKHQPVGNGWEVVVHGNWHWQPHQTC
jgi:hypothetical protein